MFKSKENTGEVEEWEECIKSIHKANSIFSSGPLRLCTDQSEQV